MSAQFLVVWYQEGKLLVRLQRVAQPATKNQKPISDTWQVQSGLGPLSTQSNDAGCLSSGHPHSPYLIPYTLYLPSLTAYLAKTLAQINESFQRSAPSNFPTEKLSQSNSDRLSIVVLLVAPPFNSSTPTQNCQLAESTLRTWSLLHYDAINGCTDGGRFQLNSAR